MPRQDKIKHTYWLMQIQGIRPEAISAAWHTHTYLIKVPIGGVPTLINFGAKELEKAKEYLYKPTIHYKVLGKYDYKERRLNVAYHLRKVCKDGYVRKDRLTKLEQHTVNKRNWEQMPQGRKLDD